MTAHPPTADAYAAAPLLNCLLRELAEPTPEPGVHRLPSGRLLRVRGERRPTQPELTGGSALAGDGGARLEEGADLEPGGGSHSGKPADAAPDPAPGHPLDHPTAAAPAPAPGRPLDHPALVHLVAEELRLHTGLDNPDLPAEMLDSRDVVAAILEARAHAAPPKDPYRRSEQSLVTGHPYHPAPKARGGGPAATWLPYAPEVYAAFPLALLGVREDQVVEEGDVSALDALGAAPPGYRLLPAHPWQLDLLGGALQQAVAEKRLIHLGTTAPDAWPTAAIRTVYTPARDLFLKFSLDVRITNDIRRLWAHDLRKLRRTDEAAARALPGAWLSDRGYRTAAFAFEELAVLVRDGFGGLTTTPLLAAALAEGFDGNPLAATTDPEGWWAAYLRAVVQPAVTGFANGVVLEAHAQNTLIAVDAEGTPVQALYRDAEGVKLLTDVDRAAGWERLVYTLVVNHLTETAAALAEHHPGFAPWPAVRGEFERYDLPEARALLSSPTLPGKTNLLLRWTRADGADARYLPLPNPMASP
ncbi:IucA/IucC family protein [Streptomyces niveiscabiei]|nr:IucA/IucC family protein [Streptomyces niveiscabiei]MDX3380764.1 IucA/IucC family protein [Streptomyces niveiscabiei]